MPVKNSKPAKIAFDLFSSVELLSHIFGAALDGTISQEIDVPRSTIRRWMEKGFPRKQTMETFIDAFPADTKLSMQAIIEQKFEYPSPLGGVLYPSLGEDWTHYRETLARLSRSAEMDVHARRYVNQYPVSDLVECLWGVPLKQNDSFPPEAIPPDDFPAGLLQELMQDRANVVRMIFFTTLATLDIEVCRRMFPDHRLHMIFLTVMPCIRKRKGIPDAAMTPERLLADLYYCSIPGTTYPPLLKDMLGQERKASSSHWSSIIQLEERFKKGTVILDDYYNLLHAWSSLLTGESKDEVKSDHEKTKHDFFFLSYVAMKLISFAYKYLPEGEKTTQLEFFRNEYINAWLNRVAFHGLTLGSGKSFDSSSMQRIIRNFQPELPAELLAAPPLS